ncbi:anthranilate synthase component I family protein [Methanospirillum sp.]|uniref:anthranilate synthase component I family protein n=1 Tax=Methanospirillum sp. TaxID=45200 RepID=UPI0035A10C4F
MDTAVKADRFTGILPFHEYEKIAEKADKSVYIPVSLLIPEPDADPGEIYKALSQDHGFLLESIDGIPKRAVRSVIGKNPVAMLSISDGCEVSGQEAQFFQDLLQNQDSLSPTDIIRTIRMMMSAYSPDFSTFSGGMAGYCRYDLVRDITSGMVHAERENGPVIRFIVPGDLVIFDHAARFCLLVAGTFVRKGDSLKRKYDDAVIRVKKLQQDITSPVKNEPICSYMPEKMPLPDHDRPEFENAVGKALEYIRAGDVAQVVLSRRFSFEYNEDPYRIYQVLRTINPSPYLYYFNFGDETVIGSSPEMLVKTEDRTVTTVPIAGTRPRGKTEAEDEKLARELLADPKELAEHLMLVDLAKEDIGMVSESDTVKVLDFLSVDKFSHVQHITSVVTGELCKDKGPVDAFEACFPAGTVSGAPKIRAMQIIQELEPVPRGIYSGAVGYIGFNGLMEFAIAIRTVIVKNNIATCQTGAGIVADSVPSREFDETQAKAEAIAQAVFTAGRLMKGAASVYQECTLNNISGSGSEC